MFKLLKWISNILYSMSMAPKKEVKEILEDLNRLEDVEACLLEMHQPIGRKIITPEKIKLKNIALWELIKRVTNDLFSVSQEIYTHGLSKIYFELKDHEIIMYFLSPRTAIIVVIPALANRGLVEVEIESSRRSIMEIMKA
ncbi:MAG: hypothetical protein JXB23_06990 [Candidatus Aminicenantes bacterium]|nr:hypothetical protein [Candidatus Aminicenantes bacterium]